MCVCVCVCLCVCVCKKTLDNRCGEGPQEDKHPGLACEGPRLTVVREAKFTQDCSASLLLLMVI